jgi:hypothetical protein
MKKKYIKPMISFQKLAMSSEVSGSCAMEITFAEWVCPVLIPEWGETVFQQDNCDWSNDTGYVCYHVPTISTNIFGS